MWGAHGWWMDHQPVHRNPQDQHHIRGGDWVYPLTCTFLSLHSESIPVLFFFPACEICSLTRDWTHVPCCGSSESQPLDCHRSPWAHTWLPCPNCEKYKNLTSLYRKAEKRCNLRVQNVHLLKRQLRQKIFQESCTDVRVGLWRSLSAKELMLLNYGVGEDSWESPGQQDQTSQS